MFEFTPLRLAIGEGWFSNQLGFCLEIDVFTINLSLGKKSFYGSIFSIYLDFWKENEEQKREISGDFLYLYQILKKNRVKKDLLLKDL